ncbi:ATP-binding protein [candidate division WOR-3 bacterium]|nr:ATP-binding protein [candidate division WOR-3 bacterium]
MNDNHSGLKYRKRWLASSLRDAISEFSVSVLTGARQVGKSTLLLNEPPFNRWRYISLDNFDMLEQAMEDPISLISGGNPIVIDEVQRAPQILKAIKLSVDKGKGKFVLSGSANILLMNKVAESLAGRAAYFVLQPMTRKEMKDVSPPGWLSMILKGKLLEEKSCKEENVLPYILRGFMPPLLYIKKRENIIRWWEGYVATYLERDLRSLSNVMSLIDFKKIMTVLSLRTGNVLNQSEVARDAGVSQSTVFRYINLLEAGHIVTRVHPFFPNRVKRMIKSPKIYWVDPALPVFLSGYYDLDSLREAREVGGFFENLVFLHLRALCQQLIPRANIYYYREISKREVDFVIEYGRDIIPIEVKMTKNPHFSDTQGLRYFLKEYSFSKAGILIHSGREIIRLGEKIIALPWTVL